MQDVQRLMSPSQRYPGSPHQCNKGIKIYGKQELWKERSKTVFIQKQNIHVESPKESTHKLLEL